jgi:hypothetical protein
MSYHGSSFLNHLPQITRTDFLIAGAGMSTFSTPYPGMQNALRGVLLLLIADVQNTHFARVTACVILLTDKNTGSAKEAAG